MILLDTNALIFSLVKPERLGRKTSQRLRSSPFVYYSALSIAELQIKADKKHLNLLQREAGALGSGGYRKLAFDIESAEAMARYASLTRKDPFDWMLISQAAAAGADFYTSDKHLLSLGLDFVKNLQD